MTVQEQIDQYIARQTPSKREDMRWLHRRITEISPGCQLRFVSGKNDVGKTVSNPSVGYGSQATSYANGDTREFYRVGLSANTAGISVYLMGLADRKYLPETYGAKLGKAKVTGYCVTFKSLNDVNIAILEEMIANHMGRGDKGPTP